MCYDAIQYSKTVFVFYLFYWLFYYTYIFLLVIFKHFAFNKFFVFFFKIEYGGKWKILHYYAKNFFAPLLVSPYEENGFVFVTIVSDLSQTLNLTLKVSVFQWSSFKPKFSEILNFTQVSIKMHFKISYIFILVFQCI